MQPLCLLVPLERFAGMSGGATENFFSAPHVLIIFNIFDINYTSTLAVAILKQKSCYYFMWWLNRIHVLIHYCIGESVVSLNWSMNRIHFITCISMRISISIRISVRRYCYSKMPENCLPEMEDCCLDVFNHHQHLLLQQAPGYKLWTLGSLAR